jgi:hypothetical protein
MNCFLVRVSMSPAESPLHIQSQTQSQTQTQRQRQTRFDEIKSVEQQFKRGIHILKLRWWLRDSWEWPQWFTFSYEERLDILQNVIDNEVVDIDIWRLIVYMSKYPQSYSTTAVEHILSIL